MPSAVNKNTALMASELSKTSSKSAFRKWLERSLMLVAIVGTIVVGMLYSDLIIRMINPPIPKSTIYGRWVEQGVAPYAREEFVLSENGVSVNGSTVATSFKFDGKTFSYRIGSSERHFYFLDKQHSKMKLDANAHYLPVFHLEGRARIAVR